MSIQLIKSAYERALKNERHEKVSETRYWCGQYRLMAEWAIDELERQANADLKKQALVAMQMDVIVGNLIREGINKHRARELAEHFIKHPQPKRESLWIDPNDKTQAKFLPNIGEPILFCHDGKVYYGQHNGGSFQCGYGVTTRYYTTWESRWMYLPAAHGTKENT